ncbi:MAG: hypothetical protein KBF21_14455 [Thermoanaerobaculia bacterium]|jgi:hypothetical protein|nr:hypothetical protein [Thermoanaerobaculia bacterium]MBP9825423.1 hypothetical protein [Thermoanaerobaculia bacterium]
MAPRSKDWSAVPGRSWEWAEGSSTSGVHTCEGKLVWWTRPGGAGGYFGEVASEQSFDAFLEAGPAVFVPDDVARELRALLEASE